MATGQIKDLIYKVRLIISRMKEGIKVIVFDVGGVLQDERYSREQLRKKRLGVHNFMIKNLKIDLDSWMDSIDTAYSDSIKGLISEKEVVNKISKNLEISKEKLLKVFGKAYRHNFMKNKKLFALAHRLNGEGYMVGILSDQWHLSKKFLIPKNDTKGFYPVIVSCDVGLRKPDLRIYELLLKKVRNKDKKIKPSNILFVDNREWNLILPRKLGMKTILFENNKQLAKDLRELHII